MDNRRTGALGVKRTAITANHASREFLHKLNEMRWNKALVDVILTGDSEGGGDNDKGEQTKDSADLVLTRILSCRNCRPQTSSVRMLSVFQHTVWLSLGREEL